MNKRSLFLIIAGLLVLGVPAAASAQEGVTPEQTIELARSASPELRAALKERERAELLVEQFRYVFVPNFTGDAGWRAGQSPQQGPTGVVFVSNQSLSTNLALSYVLPVGTQLSGGVSFDRSVVDSVILGNLGVTYGAGLRFSVNQPLMRGLGKEIGLAQLDDAQLAVDSSELQRESQANDLARDALIAYWQLWLAQQQQLIEEQALEVARSALADAEARFELGAAAGADLITLKTEVAAARESLLVSEATVAQRQTELARLFGADELPSADMQSVPKFTATPGLERSVELALANSYDLAVLKISEQRAEIQARVASDSARPDVSAVGTLDVSGLGAGAGEAFAQVGRLEALIGYVGVSAALPLNNRSSEAAAERAQIDVSRLQDDREVIERQLRAQVKLQHTNLQTATQRLELARQTAALAEQNVKTVEDRFELGRATSLEVVQALQRLRESRQRMTSALIDAQIASITLRALTGQLLTDVANPR